MDAAGDKVSARTRNRMRELSSAIKLADLDACWAAGGFTRVPVPEGRSGGARKALFDSYADGVSWGDEEEVQRALGVFEAMLRRHRPDEPSPYWEKTLAEIAEEFAHDGYEISPSLKILGIGDWRPEHAREDDLAYKEALRLLRGARNQMERLHRLTKGMVEERLRDILLVALNAYFEGRGTGETYNGDGKNDILVRVGERNILIAECKIWDGAKSISDALDQLFRYVDNGATRTALIVFFRTNDPGPLIARAVDAIENHPNHESTDRTLVEHHQQWSFKNHGNGNPGTATRATVAFIPFVIA
ncbi:hypothetical protein AQI95_28665 [Streptomyces yokosukanensis]|uniref:Uncharacterized protein n=1 Tax=Streptomyces yokosukanensis TaxID=67386 RepID=A0A101NZB1_9ACTN|nr:hypothetical protein [Streptomyces yokosukanensis]KUN02057.1 hypothetical protein AQI95_28665 [Streptomyces yokosukanensis]